jgi:hypothetical protein
MAEPKPLASLTSGLLARKGAAQPAMRRPSMLGGAMPAPSIYHDDLGWNDMGHDFESAPVQPAAPAAPADVLPLAGLTPMGATPVPMPAPIPAVVAERADLAKKVAKAMPAKAKASKPAKASAPVAALRKAAFTLRLDAERHFKLRIACALERRSAQQVVTQALDNFLNDLPEIDRLAEQLPRARGKN